MFWKSKGQGPVKGQRKKRRVVSDKQGQRFLIDERDRKIAKLVDGRWQGLPPEERVSIRHKLVSKAASQTERQSMGKNSRQAMREGSSILGQTSGKSNDVSDELSSKTGDGPSSVTEGLLDGTIANESVGCPEGKTSRMNSGRAGGKKVRKVRKSTTPEGPKSKGRWRKILLLLVVVILIIIGLSVAIKGRQGSSTIQQTQPAQATAAAQGGAKGPTSYEPLSLAKSNQPLYILLVGVDDKNPAQADALFLVAINRDRKDIDIIGLPSNTKVEGRDKKKVDSLSSMYSSGGVMLTKAVVEDMFHISIPYYVVMNQNAFTKTVDKEGQYDLYVEEPMNHKNDKGQEDIHLRQGYQALDGQSALGYVRYVDDQTMDFGRVQRQERFMKQYFALSNGHSVFTRMWRLWRLWGSYMSNISTADIVHLAWDTRSYTDSDYHFFIVPGIVEKIGKDSFWNIDPTEAQRLVGVTMGNESTDVVQDLEPATTGGEKLGKVSDSNKDGIVNSTSLGSGAKDGDKAKDKNVTKAKNGQTQIDSNSKTRKDTHE